MATVNEAYKLAKQRYVELVQQETATRDQRLRQEGFIAALEAVGAVDEEQQEKAPEAAPEFVVGEVVEQAVPLAGQAQG